MMPINIFYQNVNGLRTKTSLFYRNICLNSYDVVCITESSLTDGINNSELFDDRYLVWRRDRVYEQTNQCKGGGVILAVRRELVAEGQSDWSSSAEDLWVTLTFQNRKPKITYKMHLCVVYMCNQKMGNSFSKQFTNFSTNMTDRFFEHPSDKFIILGDFNLPNLIWTVTEDGVSYQASNIECSYQSEFFDNLNLCHLLQYNYHLNTSHNRILDLIFSNNAISVTHCRNPLVPEDPHHKALCISADFVELHSLKPRPYTSYLYECGDYTTISSKLDAVDWQSELQSKPFEDAVTFFYELITNLRNNFIPSKTVYPSTKYPLWYRTPLIKILKEKFKYHSKYKRYGNRADYESFVILRERAKVLESELFTDYIASVESKIKENPKAFWSYVKSKNQCNTYPAVLKLGQRSSDKGDEICKMFSEFFHSTFLTANSSSAIPSNDSTNFNICASSSDISAVEILQSEVVKQFTSLDLRKSAGPDNLPPTFILGCANSLSVPLTLLYRRSLSEGIVPSIWKSAFITPIHKKGPKDSVENYRPISKLCVFAKVLERLVYNQVYSALRQTLSEHQHGFLKGKSTTSNLLLCSDYLTENMSQPAQIDVVYTDYSKAFDRIDHSILLRKLQCAGIRGNLFRWFSSYVQNRSLTVVLNGYSSSALLIPSGVPQGSLLGPLLFIIFINDISTSFHYSKILLYADDMKIMCPIKTPDDSVKLQEDLDRFQTYCLLNKLDLNVSKCYICSFTRKPQPSLYNYKLQNSTLSRVSSIKDLGVTFDSKLLFNEHIDNIVKRASKALGFVIRMSAEFEMVKTFKILYCAFVRSHLEYVSQVWNPSYNTYITRIEGIQKRFLRYLQFRIKSYIPSYSTRCKKFHILPLSKRRSIADLSYLLNIANGKVDCPELLGRLGLRTPAARLRHPNLLYVPTAKTNYKNNSYVIRASRCFNVLAREVDIDLFNTSSRNLKLILNDMFFSS